MPNNSPPSSLKTAGSAKSFKLGSFVSIFKRTRSVASKKTLTPTSLPKRSIPIPPRPKQGTLFSEGNGPALSLRPFSITCDYCSTRERFTSFKHENPEADIDWTTVFASPPGMTKSDYMCKVCTTFGETMLRVDEKARLGQVISLESHGSLDDDPQEESSTHQRRPQPRNLSRVTPRIPTSALNSNPSQKY
jgi:hypothetical protein